ncbi:MAG: hypothetical protein SV760_09765, partial [Halobacteria archaeon]|nr:hypothetical protein [Halobacteria archaeon]
MESDQTVTRVELEPDTDAVFTVEIRTRLENGSEREAFDRLRSRIKRNTSRYLESFAVSVRRLVSRVENTTNRSMNVSGFSVETRVQRQLTES